MTSYMGARQNRYAPCKSKGEWQIARLLSQYGIPHIYEKPTAVIDRGQTRIWYPDFTLGYGPIIEYFGVVGDAGYEERTRHKLFVYHENLMDVIDLYRHDFHGDWRPRILRRIDDTLDRRLNGYRAAVYP